MEITDALSDYAVSTDVTQLPSEVVERTKQIVFDELSCAVLGRYLRPGRLAARYATQYGNTDGGSTVIGTPFSVMPQLAALANGTAGHADELDGTHTSEGHPGAVVVHGAFAIAEHVRAPGSQLINSVALGYDLGTRLVDAVGGASAFRDNYHLHSDFLHSFGAAASCARLMGLTKPQIENAWAIVASGVGCTARLFDEEEHMTKAFANGNAAAAGVSASLMASLGFEGAQKVFEGTHGVLDAWATQASGLELVAGLGERYAVMTANFKLMSAGYPIHAAVEAAMAVVERARIDLDEIERISVRMNSRAAETVDNRAMPSICLQDMMSVALVSGRLGFAEAHSQALLHSESATRLRAKISIIRDSHLDEVAPRGRGAIVEIYCRSGEMHLESLDYPAGHSMRGGLTWPQLDRKWRSTFLDLLPETTYDEFLELAKGLDQLDDVSRIGKALRQAIETSGVLHE